MVSRDELAALAAVAKGGLVTLSDAAAALGRSNREASTRLAALVRSGWLRRVRRGLFMIPPLDAASGVRTAIEDPWLLAIEAFSPCYIGGWTAAEHWGLTEQIFRPTFVVSGASPRTSTVILSGAEFHVVKVPRARISAMGSVWRGAEQVPISTRERTIADGLTTPSWVGGVTHLAEMLTTYREADSYAPDRLLEELERIGRGAAFKRLGYLSEILWPGEQGIHEACLAKRSEGVIALDPLASARGRIVKRWGLRVNARVEAGGGE